MRESALLFTAVVGCISAQVIPIAHQIEVEQPASYKFSYSVDAPETGDSKAQEEQRDGDSVRGYYTLVEPDGALRRVDYTADEANGFQAVVSRTPGAARAIPVVQPVQHVIASAPVVHAPVVHTPVVAAVRAAPLLKAYQPAPLLKTYQAAPVLRTVQTAPIYSTPYYSQSVSSVSDSHVIHA